MAFVKWRRGSTARAALWAAAIAGFAWTLFINGAVPGLATPTIGQAASVLGYAQAFADQHWYAIHARSVGYPVPAAVATGLPLAWVAGWFLRIGLMGADAYASAMALWLAVAFWGACRLARVFGVSPWLSAIAAATWMSMPMVWGHQGYSSLACGMAMLPLYLWSAWQVSGMRERMGVRAVHSILPFVALCVIALFMDGYTFMMFAVAASLIFVFRFMTEPRRWRMTAEVAPIYVVGFGGAYVLYALFVGRSAFDPAPLDFFRGWALDITYAAKPTAGELWIWDLLGWGATRDGTLDFGDASVWTTTFVLPLLLLAAACMFLPTRRDGRVWLCVAIAGVGLYMALGPSLKIGVTKPPGIQDAMMPPSMGIMPTGNAFITTHVPGFGSMRAAYRWEALFVLGLWALVAWRVGRATRIRDCAWALAYVAVILLSIPDPSLQWMDYTTFRRDFGAIDRDVVKPMSVDLAPGSLVLFLPITNDILAHYLAPRLHVTTYNVSGDKQLDISRAAWPARISAFRMGAFDEGDVPRVRDVLLQHEADAVVIPYFNGLNSAHVWPCPRESHGYSPYKLSLLKGSTGVYCPAEGRSAYAAAIAALREDPFVSVVESALFAVIKLRPEYSGPEGRQRAEEKMVVGVTYPLEVAADAGAAAPVLESGWYPPETNLRWSSGKASLRLPQPDSCRASGCAISLTISAFAASAQRPVVIDATVAGAPGTTNRLTLTDTAHHELVVTLPPGAKVVHLALDVPRAASPAELGMSADPRVLGLSLYRIDMMSR